MGGDFNLYRYVENDPVDWVDPEGLFVDKLPMAVDFAEGFLTPSPPTTPAGVAGSTTRLLVDSYVNLDEVCESAGQAASKAWEDYYKIENPGWKYDPHSPYYDPPKREFYLEQNRGGYHYFNLQSSRK